jgi:uncharacterized membrane protein
MTGTTLLQLANVTLAGTLLGHEVGTLVSVHPALARLPPAAHVAAERAVNARAGRVMPTLMTAALASGAAVTVDLARRRAPRAGLALAGTGALAAMLGLTLRGNLPLTRQIRTFPDIPGGPGEPSDPGRYVRFRELQARWDRLHAVRVALDAAAFGCFALAARPPADA